ncbi:hypothetical protein BDV96DRAFT_636909 [Lophiotrema nucula]|uniref:Uncharacterized protein n=1 Tax=Lophiotrema nucula TaxID=690887 RepID=A0A6A5YN31_9PLEO|nr:hypothetical protein BDV96DRAFT_636909 [Lophiotrema nucula]
MKGSAASQVFAIYELLELVFKYTPCPIDTYPPLLHLRLLNRKANAVISTSPKLRHLTWHAEHPDTDGLPAPRLGSRWAPLRRISNAQYTYFYHASASDKTYAPNPVLGELGINTDDYNMMDDDSWKFTDALAPTGPRFSFGNTCWGSMLATRSGCASLLFWMGRYEYRTYYWVVSNSGTALTVADVLAVLNRMRQGNGVVHRGQDAENWKGAAWPMEVVDGRSYPPNANGDRRFPMYLHGNWEHGVATQGYVVENRDDVDLLVLKKAYHRGSGRLEFALRRVEAVGGIWEYEEVAENREEEEWLEDLRILFKEE